MDASSPSKPKDSKPKDEDVLELERVIANLHAVKKLFGLLQQKHPLILFPTIPLLQSINLFDQQGMSDCVSHPTIGLPYSHKPRSASRAKMPSSHGSFLVVDESGDKTWRPKVFRHCIDITVISAFSPHHRSEHGLLSSPAPIEHESC